MSHDSLKGIPAQDGGDFEGIYVSATITLTTILLPGLVFESKTFTFLRFSVTFSSLIPLQTFLL